MELQTLQQTLLDQLKSRSTFTLYDSAIWCVPVHTLNVSYKPVTRSKMDILMKMLLISLQKANFHNAEQISEILLVEELFIQDLLTKMQKTGLIMKEKDFYELTDKGLAQLTSGVYEEEQEMANTELLYSPTHASFLQGEIEQVLDFEDFPEAIYRHSVQFEQSRIDHQQLIEELQILQEADVEEKEPNQTLITAIDSVEDIQINDVPCIEYILFDEQKSEFSVRIWNTLLETWDITLEQQLKEKEMTIWREKFMNK